MKFKYLLGTENNPYYNLAMEQELMKSAVNGTAILFLWQNDNTIIIGRNQNAYSECRVDDFLQEGGYIARRRSGGGAVYHDLGNLNYSIICDMPEQQVCMYQNIVPEVISLFGISAEYNGRNDIIVDGKKCSGNAIYQDVNAVCQHGTLLIASNIERMVSYLTPDRSKLERNHVASVESRVMNLSRINSDINIQNVIKAFIQVTNSVKLENIPDKNRIEKLAEFYRSKEWVYGGRR